MSDLHARILAAVTARRDLAQAVTRGPWERAADHDTASGRYPDNAIGYWDGEYAQCVSYSGTGSGEQADTDARFIAVNDPAQILRDTQAHLELLEQHRPIATKVWEYLPALDGLLGDYLCQHGRQDQSIVAFPVPWPCETITALASIYPEENPNG